MDSILGLFLCAMSAILLGLLLNKLTRSARRSVAQKAMPPVPAPAASLEEGVTPPQSKDEGIQPFQYPYTEPPEPRQTAEYWWAKLLSGGTVLGAIFSLLEPIILVINSYLLALRLEILLGHVGDPLFTLNILQWEREITVFDLVGLLIGLIQIIAAASLAYLRNTRESNRDPTLWLALATWVLVFFVEVALSAWGGGSNETHVMVITGALAGVLVLAESLVGVFCLELFFIPLVLSIAWTTALPIKVIVKVIRLKASQYWSKPRDTAQADARRHAKLKRVATFIGALDSIFVPLRKLDALVYRLLRRITRGTVNKESKGEVVVCANSN